MEYTISAGLRALGYQNPIIITHHGLTQRIVNSAKGNKFLFICAILRLQLDGIVLPHIAIPERYWHYEVRSEKITSIYLHILAENHGLSVIYHNHAGCERGYFITAQNNAVAISKETEKPRSGRSKKIPLPDIAILNTLNGLITVVEGKKLSTLPAGLREVDTYNLIEDNYFLDPDIGYPHCTIERYLSIFGGNSNELPHDRVLIYINNSGDIYTHPDAPLPWPGIFLAEGIV